MAAAENAFRRSIEQQIALNRARTPTERMNALCDLLDAVRAMAPQDAEACERRYRAQSLREQNREQLRAQLRRLNAAGRSDPASGV